MKNYTYSINETLLLMKTFNALWLRVFYHNASLGDYFTTKEEVGYINTQQMFSIIGSIDETYQIAGYYEFLYEVPGYEGYNRWKQKVHPFQTTAASTSESNGYKPIELSWIESFDGGISITIGTFRSFYDCSVGNNSQWWYPIGAKSKWVTENKLPAFQNEGNVEASTIVLWIRLPTKTELFENFRITCKTKRTYQIVNHIFICVLI